MSVIRTATHIETGSAITMAMIEVMILPYMKPSIP